MSSELEKQDSPEDDQPQGPNLVVMYTLLGIALLVAIFFALAVVRPFYLRR